MAVQNDPAGPDGSICVRVIDSDGRTVSEFRTADEREAMNEFLATSKTGFGELYGLGSHVAILDPNLRVGASYLYEGRQCYQWRFDKELGAQLAASANDPAVTAGSYKTKLQLIQEAEGAARAVYLSALQEGSADPQERAKERAHGMLCEDARPGELEAITDDASRVASRVDRQVSAEKMLLDWLQKDVGTLLRAMTSSELRKAQEVLNSMTPVEAKNTFWLGRSVPENAERFESKIDAAQDFIDQALDEMSAHRGCRTHEQEAGFLCYEYLADRAAQSGSAAILDREFAAELGDWLLRRQQAQLPVHPLVNKAVIGLSMPGAAYRGFGDVVELANLYGQVPAHLDPRFAKTLPKSADDLLLVQFDDHEEFLHGSLLYVDVESGAEFRVPYVPDNYNTIMAADLLQRQMRSVRSMVQSRNPDMAQRDDAMRVMEDRMVKLLDGVQRPVLCNSDVDLAKRLRLSRESCGTPAIGELAFNTFSAWALDIHNISIPRQWDGTVIVRKNPDGANFRVELGVGDSETVVALSGVLAIRAHELMTRLNMISIYAEFSPQYEEIKKRGPLAEMAVNAQDAAP